MKTLIAIFALLAALLIAGCGQKASQVQDFAMEKTTTEAVNIDNELDDIDRQLQESDASEEYGSSDLETADQDLASI